MIEGAGFLLTLYDPYVVGRSLSDISDFSVVDDPRGARHVVGLRLSPVVPHPGSALLALHHGLQRLHGDYGPRSVDLPGPRSPMTASDFGAKLNLGCPDAVLRLPTGLLSGSPRSSLARQIRDALTDRLGTRSIALADVARSLTTSPRTVQRLLIDEGLTYTEILDCVRRRAAHTLLTTTSLSLADISTHLAFAEPAVLTRCARRWWNHTPTAHRTLPGDGTPSDGARANSPRRGAQP